MKIYAQMNSIMSKIGHIEKSRTNSTQGSGYKFRGIDDILEAAQKLLVEYKVFCAPKVIDHLREERQSKSGGNLIYTVLKMQYDFYTDDGSSVSCVTMGEAMDSGDKSCNKAMSAAMKYAFVQVFCIPTEGDNDTENNSPEVFPKKDLAQAPFDSDAPPHCGKPMEPGLYPQNVPVELRPWYCRTCKARVNRE